MAATELATTLEKLQHAVEKQTELLGRFLNGKAENRPEGTAAASQLERNLREKDASTWHQQQITRLWEAVREQSENLQSLTARLSAVVAHENEIRALLLEAHGQLLRRDLEFERQMAAFERARAGNGSAAQTDASENRYLRYRFMLERVQAVVQEKVPPGAVVVIVSKGDSELVRLDGRTGWHFPQAPDGVYAGHYPPSSSAAIDHLEALRARGGTFLLFPGTAFWWLEHYKDFGQHLDSRFARLHSDDDCLLYDLSSPPVETR